MTRDQHMPSSIRLIAFDADDTLWHNERIYRDAQGKWRPVINQIYPFE